VKAWLPLLAAVLAACGSTDMSPQAECERKADDDPKVAEIYSRSNGVYTQPILSELAVVKRQATLRCLRAKGLAPPGGVEPVRRS
jgi:hypothetical protein